MKCRDSLNIGHPVVSPGSKILGCGKPNPLSKLTQWLLTNGYSINDNGTINPKIGSEAMAVQSGCFEGDGVENFITPSNGGTYANWTMILELPDAPASGGSWVNYSLNSIIFSSRMIYYRNAALNSFGYTVAPGNKYRLLFRSKSSNEVELYLNGSYLTTIDVSAGGTNYLNCNLLFTYTGTFRYNGKVSRLVIFDKCISNDEINLYLSNKIIPNDSVIHYNFSEGFGNIAYNLSNNNHGTYSGTNYHGLQDFYPHNFLNGFSKGDQINRVSNGTFNTDTGWTKQTGWSISDGKAHCSGVQTANFSIYQNVGIVYTKTYKISYELSNYSAGNVRIIVGVGGTGAWQNLNGVVSEIIKPTSSGGYVYIQADIDFIGSIDNVVVEEHAYIPSLLDGSGKDVLGNNLTNPAGDFHNLAESLIDFSPEAIWDKSNAGIWDDDVRSSVYYDAANPFRWHSSELNVTFFEAHAVGEYQNRVYAKKILDGEAQVGISEVIQFPVKQNTRNDKVIKNWLGDY